MKTMEILSIHDLTRRSTLTFSRNSPSVPSFNSRPHKEVDGRLGETLRSRRLSIHDLTRRSTDNHQSAGSVTFFQFTTSQGGRQRSDYCDNRGDPFNSRPHKEVDQPGERKASKTITFQFTTSQGGRRDHMLC